MEKGRESYRLLIPLPPSLVFGGVSDDKPIYSIDKTRLTRIRTRKVRLRSRALVVAYLYVLF